jgi:hypothetical protein
MVLEHLAYPPPPPNRIELTLQEEATQLAFPSPPPLPSQPPLPNAQVHTRLNRPRRLLCPFADLPGEAADEERRLRKQVRGIVCRPALTSLCTPLFVAGA